MLLLFILRASTVLIGKKDKNHKSFFASIYGHFEELLNWKLKLTPESPFNKINWDNLL